MLLVDPDHRSKEITHALINGERISFSYEFQTASPADAMSILSRDYNSLVVISLRSSEDEGLRLCGQIRRISHVPIILIGGSKDFQVARKALSYRVSDFLPDPFMPRDFVESMEKVKSQSEDVFASRSELAVYPANKASSVPSASIIDKVTAYIEDTLDQNITLKEISNIFHFNYSYLGQKFKDQMSMTFKEYLLQQRMEKAKYLLANTNLKVYEIAKEVGYVELDWFYKKFKSYTGVSAKEFRKQITLSA
ncbi:response regulator [Paenibacillus sp. CAA11]|uniref:response regulator n=1 Tax=Paenibacillus sp. CAA11 TaxID=1532905 RepID=UPI001F301E25|nr:response regulator [Paenibacillus sp. CAA11]